MTDAELRQSNQGALADRLVDRVQHVGAVLYEHRGLRKRLSAAGAAAWDGVMHDVERTLRRST